MFVFSTLNDAELRCISCAEHLSDIGKCFVTCRLQLNKGLDVQVV